MARLATRGLPRAEADYYRLVDRWANSGFDATPRSLLDRLVEQSSRLHASKVKFPQYDDRLLNSLRDNMDGHEPSTFGNVARHMKAFFLIDIENGHYHHAGRQETPAEEMLKGG